MLNFESDYISGAHPKVLEALVKTNAEPLSGYGADKYTHSAKKKIAAACGGGVKVEFLSGGTQTNAVIISTLLNDWEGVIAADTGHIALHEAGAIEFSGNKVITVRASGGKIDIGALKDCLKGFYEDDNREHMVFPGMVYISQPTEYGTVYSLKELESLSAICEEYNMKLFVDGARLGYAIESEEADFTLADLSRLCDVFYIGGTKGGALCGEAVVFKEGCRPRHFLNSVKKRGALLAKGRLLGVQFDALFSDGLYFEIAAKANEKARLIENVFVKNGFKEYIKTSTNQKFFVLTDSQNASLCEKIKYSFWERIDKNRIVVRLACCWSTTVEDINELEKILNNTRI